MKSTHYKPPAQRALRILLALWSINLLCGVNGAAEDLSGKVKKAIEKSTLDQPGTMPFHLKASFAPSQERDIATNRVGEVEIWWQAPNRWRRELHSPEFHQVAIQDGDHRWEKNDGDYFPDWLRELVVAIVQPIPLSSDVLSKRLQTAEVRHLMGQTNIDWEAASEFSSQQANGKGGIALIDKTGLLLYTDGPAFGGLYHDFKDFHGRMVAHTVASGNVEVTAKLSVLEDLGSVPEGFFNATADGGDAHPIETLVLSDAELRQNLLAGTKFVWPAVKDGPLEGNVGTDIVLDRQGKIREMDATIAENPAVTDAAAAGFRTMEFRPFLKNGVPVQVVGRLNERFKTTRPPGVETFDSAQNYFERGRKASFLAAGATSPYKLRAAFQVGTSKGIQSGRYEDTWVNASEWKREAWFGSSHLVKSQSGEKRYVQAEGPESGMLRMVMRLMEPIPAADTMTESDWRIRRDTLDGSKTIRVFRGPEGPNGELDPGKSEGFWFDDAGHMIKTYVAGFEVLLSKQADYETVKVARQIDVLKDGQVGMRIVVNEVAPTDPAAAKDFKLKGHEWQRAFTAEVR